jgi:hypothetical protein
MTLKSNFLTDFSDAVRTFDARITLPIHDEVD